MQDPSRGRRRQPGLAAPPAALDETVPDDVAAGRYRSQYRAHGLEPIPVPESASHLLADGELVLARDPAVVLERRPDPRPWECAGAELLVTTRRLLHLARPVRWIWLADIDEAALADDRVLLLLRGGRGIALRTGRPRLLRAVIAVAREAAARGEVDRPPSAAPSPEPASDAS